MARKSCCWTYWTSGLPVATEFLDLLGPAIHQRSGDLGRHRRTTTDQPPPTGQRPVLPVGFKMGPMAPVKVAADAVVAGAPRFMGMTKMGQAAILKRGNQDAHHLAWGPKPQLPTQTSDTACAVLQTLRVKAASDD